MVGVGGGEMVMGMRCYTKLKDSTFSYQRRVGQLFHGIVRFVSKENVHLAFQ